MTAAVGTTLLAWVVLALVGAAVLCTVRPAVRDLVLPAAPLVGAAFLVVALHGGGWLLSVRAALPVVGLVVVGLVVVGVVRGTTRPFVGRPAAGWTAAGLLVGLPFSLVALAPSLRLGDPGVVSATTNNDAVFYVSVSNWLQRHPITAVPQIPPAPGAGDLTVVATPGDGPALTSLTAPLRVGQELVQAALNTVTGTSSFDTFSPWLAAWVLLVPGGCLAAAALLGLPRAAGLTAGVVLAGSTVVAQQVYNQNAASLLGIAMAPLVLAAVAAAVGLPARRRPPPGDDAGPGGAPPVVPVLLAAVLLAGVVGTYTEYLPFLGPALAGLVLLRLRGWRRAVGRGLAVVALSGVVAPLVWIRAVGSVLAVRGGAAEVFGSPYLGVDPGLVVSRLTGASALPAVLVSPATAVLAGLVVVGALLAVLLDRRRGLWAGFLVAGAPFIAYLTVQDLGYTQRRAIDIAYPVLLLVAVAGWTAAVRALRHRARAARGPGPWARALPVLVAAGTTAAVALWAGANVTSSLTSFDPASLAHRHVDDDFADVERWVEEVGGPGGADVSVLVPEFFDQQWTALALADEDDVEYPALRPDYLRTGSFWSGGSDRWWVVGTGVQVLADAGAVVHQNDRFRLVDLSRGDTVIAAPFDLVDWAFEPDPEGLISTAGDAPVLVLRGPGAAATVQLEVAGPVPTPVELHLTVPGQPDVVVPDLTDVPRGVTLQLPAGDDPVLVQLSTPGDSAVAGKIQIQLRGVGRAG